MSFRTYITMPKCPICLQRYSNDVKPLILQPCCHGVCEDCMEKYRESTEGETKCPKCREIIIEEKPNYDMIDMMPDEYETRLWAQKLVDCMERAGISVVVTPKIEIMSKFIVTRVINDDRLQTIGLKTKQEWTETDSRLVRELKQEFNDCINVLEMDFQEATKWVQVMNLPPFFENYFITQVITMFENKKFLKEFEAEWLMDLIPMSV